MVVGFRLQGLRVFTVGFKDLGIWGLGFRDIGFGDFDLGFRRLGMCSGCRVWGLRRVKYDPLKPNGKRNISQRPT